MAASRKSRLSSSHNTSRVKCSQCNELDPRGHSYSSYSDTLKSRRHNSSAKHDVQLSLPIDTLRLSRPNEKGCRYCRLLGKALDSFLPDWRRRRPPITIDLAWAKPVRLTVKTSHEKSTILEIYWQSSELSGLRPFLPTQLSRLFFGIDCFF